MIKEKRAVRRWYEMVEAEELYEFVGAKRSELRETQTKKRKVNKKQQSKMKLCHSSEGRQRRAMIRK